MLMMMMMTMMDGWKIGKETSRVVDKLTRMV
jgi:hypothetical protein